MGLLNFLRPPYFPSFPLNRQMGDLTLFIFDEAKCLAPIPFGEKVNFTFRQQVPFFPARPSLRLQPVAFAGDCEDHRRIRLILPYVRVKDFGSTFTAYALEVNPLMRGDADRHLRICIIAIRQDDDG